MKTWEIPLETTYKLVPKHPLTLMYWNSFAKQGKNHEAFSKGGLHVNCKCAI